MNQINPGTQEILSNFEEQISFADLWSVLVKYRAVIISIIVAAVIAAIFYALSLPAIYRANVLMAQSEGMAQISRSVSDFDRFAGLASLAGVTAPESGGEYIISMATLQSRTFAYQFVKDNNLLPILLADDWDKEKGEWKKDKVPDYWNSYNAFKDIYSVSTDTEGMIYLAVEWTDPVLAAEWANSLVASINYLMRNEAIMEAEKSINFLQDQLKITSLINTQSVIYTLMEEHTKRITLANIRPQYSFKVIDSAVAPNEKSKPNRRMIVVFGLIIGVVIGIGLAFVLNFIQNYRDNSRKLTAE